MAIINLPVEFLMENEGSTFWSSTEDEHYEKEQVQIVHSLPFYVMEIFVSGSSTAFTKTAVAPLERIKILLQTRAEGFSSIGVYGSLKKVVKHEGIRGLYKANGLCIFRMLPHFAFHYMTYEQYRGFLHDKFPSVGRGPLLDILADSAAGGTAFLCTYPLDLARTKYAYQVVDRSKISCSDGLRCIHSGHPAHQGIIDVFKAIYRRGGMLAFYQSSHEEIKRWVPKEHQNSIALNLSCGALAGLFGQTVMYPLDVVRRQMQVEILNQSGTRYNNVFEGLKAIITFKDIIRNQGWRQLYAGLCINI